MNVTYSSFLSISCLDGSSGSACGPYAIYIAPQTSVAAFISTLHTAMVVHMEDPLSEFHDVMARIRRLLWSLPLVALWHEFRL